MCHWDGSVPWTIPTQRSGCHTIPISWLLKNVVWTWHERKKAFSEVKLPLRKFSVFVFYDLSNLTTIGVDISSFGLEALLYQEVEAERKPIAFALRTLMPAERNYAQIEKECLAAVWVCEKFDRYITGLDKYRLLTDHKQLVPLKTCKILM